MFESETKLRRDVVDILDSLRAMGGGSYAAVFDARSLVAESADASSPIAPPLRRLLQAEAEALLGLNAALQSGEDTRDHFADFANDAFLLAVVNGRVGVLAACADAQRLEADAQRLLRALVDRLLRLDAGWRYDEKGRGLFFGSPRLDTIVIPRPEGSADA